MRKQQLFHAEKWCFDCQSNNERHQKNGYCDSEKRRNPIQYCVITHPSAHREINVEVIVVNQIDAVGQTAQW